MVDVLNLMGTRTLNFGVHGLVLMTPIPDMNMTQTVFSKTWRNLKNRDYYEKVILFHFDPDWYCFLRKL